MFTEKSNNALWVDWLSIPCYTVVWNNWSENEKLLQLAEHLRGKAAQECTARGL